MDMVPIQNQERKTNMSYYRTGNKDVVNDTFEVSDPTGNKRDLNNHEWGGSHWTKDATTGEVLTRREDGTYEPSVF